MTEKEIKIKQALAIHQALRQKMQPTAWVMPAVGDCIRYAVMESAEVLDAEMRQRRNHARNNERMQSDTAIGVELADVIIMAHSALMQMDNEYVGNSFVAEAISASMRPDATVDSSVDGLWSDVVALRAMVALEDYTMMVSSHDDDTSLELYMLARSLGKVIGLCHSLMVRFGFDTVTFVKNKCNGFAMKHGEAYQNGFGLTIVDSLEELYNGFNS